MNLKALIKSLLLRKFTTALLVLQLAITLGLLVNSGILALDTRDKLAKSTGLDDQNVVVVSSHPTSGQYKDLNYYRSIAREDMSKLSQIPGVKAVSITNQLPMTRRGMLGNVYDRDNPERHQQDAKLKNVPIVLTTPSYLEAMSLELVSGRFLNDSDERDADNPQPDNVVITESLQKALFGDESAVGKALNQGRVVGVVKDFMVNPTLPDDQQFAVLNNNIMEYIFIGRHYVMHVEPGQVESVKQEAPNVVLDVQPERDIFETFTLAERLEDFYSSDQGLADLFLVLCDLMIFVTIISSYAYSQFHISRQQKFIGIRRALGAKKKDILLYVLTENWLVYLLGVMFGIAIALGFNVALSQHLVLSKPTIDIFLLAIGVLFLSGTAATLFPAYKTSRISPIVATKTV